MEEQKPVTVEQIQQVGYLFIQFLKEEYDNLKVAYHNDENVKKVMDLPAYCYTMFIVAIKSYHQENP